MSHYNTVEGIERYIADLAGLHRLIKDRSAAGYERHECLDEFIILGRWRTDSCGNFGSCYFEFDNKPESGDDFAANMAPVVRCNDMNRVVCVCTTSTFEGSRSVGPVDGECDECGRGWTLANAHDVAVDQANVARHVACRAIRVERRTLEQYRRIVDKAGMFGAVIVPSPNAYWPDAYKAERAQPWCLIKTPRGDIRMGWRKRVISIDWTDIMTRAVKSVKDYEQREALHEAFDATRIFPGEDVTKDGTLIHAWGEDKAAEYLNVVGYFGYLEAV